MTARALPLADAPELRAAARRTALVRAGLLAALAAALAAAYLLAPGGGAAPAAAAAGEGQVIVLDVSGSIGDAVSAHAIRRLLGNEVREAGPNGHVGLVLFSDSAVETLPPSAPARDLLAFRRFFVAYGTAHYVMPPWTPLVGGTAISTGLTEGLDALRRAGMPGGRVLLVSDLLDAPQDGRALTRVLRAYARLRGTVSLQVRVLPSSAPQPVALYRSILGRGAVQPSSAPPPPPPAVSTRPAPVSLLLAAGIVALALALRELLAEPLRWRAVAETAS